MILLIDGTPGSDIPAFLLRLQEETVPCIIQQYDTWHYEYSACHGHDHDQPSGIIFMRVLPEIAYARLQKEFLSGQHPMSIDQIKMIHAQKDQLFIENKNNIQALEQLPVLVLNGNIDFKTDFSQFYNHLFYIRRFLKQIEERKEIALGIHKPTVQLRRCC